MRIAVAGLSHEALTFCPEPTRMADFDIWAGDEVLEFPGLEGLAEELDLEIAPNSALMRASAGLCESASAESWTPTMDRR
jgi:microcystin degradation protein MlrC